MKLKNVGFIEKHVEKIVLAVTLIYVAIVFWLFVSGAPYSVTVTGSPDPLQPAEVEQKLLDKSSELRGKIDSLVSPLPPTPIPLYTADFQRRVIQSSINPTQRYDVPWNLPGLDPNVWHSGTVIIPEYILVSPQLPTNLRAATDFAVVSLPPGTVAPAELVSLIGKAKPMDINYVTVAGDFNIGAWRDANRKVPEGNRVPDDWLRNAMLVTDVTLERQTWDPSTSQWGPVEQLPGLPGDVSYKTVPSDVSPADVIQTIKLDQDSISRAPFLTVNPKHPWHPPQQEMGVSLAPAPIMPSADVTPAPAAAPAVRISAQAPAPAAPAAGPAGHPGPGGAAALPAVPAPRAKPSFIGNPSVILKSYDDTAEVRTVWAHDVTVKPGGTYRYRLNASVFNPLFQKSGLLIRQRLQYYNTLSLSPKPPSDDSKTEWVEVTIPPNQYFFVTGSNGTQQNATVEVWRIFDGGWQPQEFTVQAGDPIGKVLDVNYDNNKVQTDLRTGATVVDIEFASQPGGATGTSTTSKLLYLDNQNKLQARSIDADRENQMRIKFRSDMPAPAAPEPGKAEPKKKSSPAPVPSSDG